NVRPSYHLVISITRSGGLSESGPKHPVNPNTTRRLIAVPARLCLQGCACKAIISLALIPLISTVFTPLSYRRAQAETSASDLFFDSRRETPPFSQASTERAHSRPSDMAHTTRD